MSDLMKWTRADVLQTRCQSGLAQPCWSRVETLPDMLAMPGTVVGSVLLLVLGHPVLGNYTIPGSSTRSNTTDPNKIAAIVAPVVVLSVLAIVLAVLAWLFCVVKKKRQTEGTYRPSAEEQSGTHSVATPDALKLPKEERLI